MKSAHFNNNAVLLPSRESTNQRRLASNRRYELVAGGVESAAYAAILAMYGYANSIFEEQAKYALFPTTAFFKIMRTFFMLRNMFIPGLHSASIGIRGGVEIFTSVAMVLTAIASIDDTAMTLTDGTDKNEVIGYALTAIFACDMLARFGESYYLRRNTRIIFGVRLHVYDQQIAENLFLGATSFATGLSTCFSMGYVDHNKIEADRVLGIAAGAIATAVQWSMAYQVTLPKWAHIEEAGDDEADQENQRLFPQESAAASPALSYVPPAERSATATLPNLSSVLVTDPSTTQSSTAPRRLSRSDSAGILASIGAAKGSGTFNPHVPIDLLTSDSVAVSGDAQSSTLTTVAVTPATVTPTTTTEESQSQQRLSL